MRVFDEITKQFMSQFECACVVVKHLPDQIIFGYSSRQDTLVDVAFWTNNGELFFKGDKELLKENLVYSKKEAYMYLLLIIQRIHLFMK